MKAVSFLLLLVALGVKSLDCPDGQLACGLIGCYDPVIQGCTDNNGAIQCLNSCNGTCYSNTQFCYNDVKVCNNDQLVCDIQYYTAPHWFPLGPTCYNPSQYNCYNNTLCQNYLTCGTQCITGYDTACANNQTICNGFDAWWYYYYHSNQLDVCGPQQQCYDKTQSVCLNETTVCQGGNAQLCDVECFNPDLQICISGTVQCLNSCNGACYSNTQFCYNDVKICNNDQLVCDIQYYNAAQWFPLGPSCYNPSQYSCYNNTLCQNYLTCGTQCITDYNAACANNQTICNGFDPWWYYYYYNDRLDVCGPQQQCYDNTLSVCVSETTVCHGMNAQLCDIECFNPDLQICVNGAVQCLNSCNGTCYTNTQFCYNDVKICNNDQLVCDIKYYTAPHWFPLGPTCYNPSQYSCYNNTLCQNYLTCGMQCVNDYNAACANNQTICPGFDPGLYYYFHNDRLDVCGPQQQCYDNTLSVCLGDNGTVCPIGYQLCSGECYNPQSQYCAGGNNTIFCINNPSEKNCLTTTTQITSTPESSSTTTTKTTTETTTIGDCCAIQNCTTDFDCCQSASLECQCYRHIQTDVYGSCVNPYTVPVCGDDCPVQVKCKFDSDCCKCQCAQVTFTGSDGESVTRKQCVRR